MFQPLTYDTRIQRQLESMTPKEMAAAILSLFDGNKSKKVYEAITDVLITHGYKSSAALEVAEEYESQVIHHLKQHPPTALPFDFSSREKNRLIGKLRQRRDDAPEALFARAISLFLPAMRQALVSIDEDDFETLCAASLKLAGATEAFALRTHDEGGIDFFGRIPLRNQLRNIPATLLRTPLLRHSLFLLGQAKRYRIQSSIGRPEVQKFAGQVKECLAKYPGNVDPPKMRVPDKYYIPNEPCLPIFITSSSFSDRVPGTAFANGILTVDGQELAEFLLANRIGVIEEAGKHSFSEELFKTWLKDQIEGCVFKR